MAHDEFLVLLDELQLAFLQLLVALLHQVVAFLVRLIRELRLSQSLLDEFLLMRQILVLPEQLLVAYSIDLGL